MKDEGSVTICLRRLRDGDQAALEKLWDGYFGRLVGLARQRLRGAPLQAADEEDVALDAFDSFQRAAQRGRFARLENRNDLWQVLELLTKRKASNLARNARAGKRGAGRVVSASALDEEGRAFAELIGREPTPAFACEMADEYRRLLDMLPAELGRVAEWRLEGHSNAEIAKKLGRKVSTAERKVARIRGIWENEVAR
jgi:DNA-directed RNA polymerase specialized sigma24 family protein